MSLDVPNVSDATTHLMHVNDSDNVRDENGNLVYLTLFGDYMGIALDGNLPDDTYLIGKSHFFQVCFVSYIIHIIFDFVYVSTCIYNTYLSSDYPCSID